MEIQNYPNYLIYDDGRVYSKYYNRFLKPSKTSEGYYEVRLFKNKKSKHFTIHKLLGLHFIPNPDNKPCIDHINRKRTDNRLENLRWVTHSQNNSNVIRPNRSNMRYIRTTKSNTYRIGIKRNKLYYSICVKTKEEAIKQRDLMLSMWDDF